MKKLSIAILLVTDLANINLPPLTFLNINNIVFISISPLFDVQRYIKRNEKKLYDLNNA